MKRSVVSWFAVAAIVGAAGLAACRIKTESSLSGPGGGGGGGGGGGEPAGGGDAYGAGAYGGGAYGVEVITDDTGRQYKVQQGRRGAPGEVGCSDGQREAFVDDGAFPRIAGCLASWQGRQSLRAAGSGAACGDDAGECATPASACAPGWRVCGAGGAVADLKQVSGEQCEHAGGGRFSAAISHCTKQSGCEYDKSPNAVYPCFERGWCSEPVCCGDDCGDFGACRDGIWDGATHIPVGTDQGCASATSARAGGILCCRE